MRRQGRRTALAAAISAGLAIGALVVAAPVTAEDAGGAAPRDAASDVLGSHDLDLLAEAEASGERRVTLIVATDKGRAGTVSSGLSKLGGTVARRFDSVGYVRADVPVGAVRRAARLPGVSAIDLDETIQRPDPRPEAKQGAKPSARTTEGPGADTRADNPFMPTGETGAVAFKRRHPTWDGRGVTIGVLDAGIDLDNPWLQKTSTGERKVVDWVTATDPLTDGDRTWRAMLTEVDRSTWKAPAGTFLFNRFSESITELSSPEGDVNRDGDTDDRFGVLYDPATHDVWVDVNQNRDFTDDRLMRPYRERFDVGHFGTDDPATAVREQMPFVVEYREDVDLTPAGLPGKADFVNIGIIEDAHGSHVAGIAAANDMLGNPRFDGAAPGARLVSARACSWGGGCTFAALTDGMVDLVVRRHVDVVNMSIGGLPALNDGDNARAQLYNRLIRDFGVQLIFSAGNSGPGINTVGDPGVATDVVSVGSSISRATWLANYGSVTRVPYQLHNFSSRGPREDGGFKPNLAAPGSAISTTPLWQPGGPVAEAGYDLPPGLQMFNGTSMASPETTGVAALLLSAAKATDRAVTPAGMRRALYTSAELIPGVPTYAQGNGLVDANGAWRLLERGVDTRGYTVEAPVCTAISQFLTTPHRGAGIYNDCPAADGGHRPGQRKSYRVTVTRTSGPSGSIQHDLEWVGNDGTFSSPRSVSLPLGRPVSFTVQARPGSGVHGATLHVDDPRTSVVDHEMSAVVVAPNTPSKPGWGYSTEGRVDRNLYTSYFVTVPEGAKALQINLTGIATGSQTRFIAISPYGVPMESTSSLVCYTNFSDPADCNPNSRAYEDPIPGVWEIEVEARRTSPSFENPFELTAAVQGVQVEPAIVNLPNVKVGQPTPVTWTLTNLFAPIRVRGEGGPLGSAFTDRPPTIATNETHTYEVTVPEGATRFEAVIGNASDPGADLDLTVFNEAGDQVGQSADGDSEEAVAIDDPEPGTYTVEVFGFDVPAGTTAYDYRDVFFSPALGSVSVPSAFVTLPNGATTQVKGTVTALAAPSEGRQLFGDMSAVTDEGAVVGRGSVLIGSVD